MAAAYHAITVEQGARWLRVVTVTDDGTARDLTGYTIRMQVRNKVSSPDPPFLEMDTDGNGITITDAENGQFQLELTAVETAALVVVSGYKYDLELVPPSGEDDAERLLYGDFTVSPEVTR